MRSPTATSSVAVVVLQFGDLDRRLALAADVDERHLRPDRDDRALDGLALLDALRLDRRLEHRGEISSSARSRPNYTRAGAIAVQREMTTWNCPLLSVTLSSFVPR